MVKTSKNKTRQLTMGIAGGLIKHLGLQMYSGAVPAIAELIANAWDSMAKNVYVEIPSDKSFETTDKIVVKDDGHGMTFEECEKKYLLVGRDRRKEEGDYSNKFDSLLQRKVMARKGIGKLSGFGIANRIEIRTVKSGEITHFALDFDAMTKSGKFIEDYHPEMLSEDGKKTQEPSGTTITLTQIKISRAIGANSFRTGMVRRFTILSDTNFSVFVNGERLTKSELAFQFRYPIGFNAWQSENVSGVGEIKWWIGFTEQPIPDEDARGMVVFARGKMAQAPWFFGLSGGTWGQHGMQYMTGEVIADQLDLTDGQDFIATDRASSLWEEPLPAVLKEWGIKKIREHLEKWAEARRKAKITRPEVTKYLAYAEKLPEKERKIFNSFVDKLCSIPQIDKDKEILDELIQFGYNALTNHHFMEVIKQINAASSEDRTKIFEILSEWDVMEAVMTAQKVKGRVEIIRKFAQMIEDKIPEKPDMQDYVEKHPWLVDPSWESFRRENSIDRILKEEFGMPGTNDKEGRKIPDFFCLGDSKTVYIVDLKRPGDKVGKAELDQIRDYVLYVKKRADNETTDVSLKKSVIGGLIVCGQIEDDTKDLRLMLKSINVDATEWGTLLRIAETLHRDFLNVIKDRAKEKSPDDPRLAQLEQIGITGNSASGEVNTSKK